MHSLKILFFAALSAAIVAHATEKETTKDSRKIIPKKKDYMAENYVKPAASELKKKLTAEQFQVTQQEGTERPYSNAYWNNHEAGIYVDIVSGEPLFSSVDKYDSGTGWPSFSKPLVKENVTTKTDRSMMSERTEVRSKKGDSHLGHVFDDGPGPSGERYCMNSASLRFIKAADLEKEGYGEYAHLFLDKAKK